jgi:hypothetical protein
MKGLSMLNDWFGYDIPWKRHAYTIEPLGLILRLMVVCFQSYSMELSINHSVCKAFVHQELHLLCLNAKLGADGKMEQEIRKV